MQICAHAYMHIRTYTHVQTRKEGASCVMLHKKNNSSMHRIMHIHYTHTHIHTFVHRIRKFECSKSTIARLHACIVNVQHTCTHKYRHTVKTHLVRSSHSGTTRQHAPYTGQIHTHRHIYTNTQGRRITYGAQYSGTTRQHAPYSDRNRRTWKRGADSSGITKRGRARLGIS